ncbi:hypothetical protein Krac_7121 [Ktedonobacter racemifer DSM 44963]|uniref:Uncharacterized protein n=1 Tax=Ktedonobacter racemifer DSM 44963 TaxID=485913 RepID=D6TQZ7_KTERA|nr:hypothetical protein Krac_7121 [Ktedonobacter racemifer DSM 44963]
MGGWLALIVTIHTNVTDSSRQNGPFLYESLYSPFIVAIITLKYSYPFFTGTSLEIS